MNTRKKYDKLSKRERLSLYLRAQERGDRLEMEAIVSASPGWTISAVDFYPEVDSFALLMSIHFIEQLDRLLTVVTLLFAQRSQTPAWPCAQYLAREYLTAESAWTSLCRDYGVNYERRHAAVLAGLRTFGKLEASGILEQIAATDPADRNCAIDGLPSPVVTEDEKKREYQGLLDELATRLLPS